ncbi:MAG: DUF4296 domain-containing protein [Flavobacteriales bacterium]|nr:DUF4296 domain-containing protein [Flavobacteriales bacterium]
MNGRYWLLVIGCLWFGSCQENAEKKPDYLLDEDKMVSVMVDMHLVETAQNLKVIEPDSANLNYDRMFESIFVSHGVTKTEFDSSLYYYSTRTEEMNVIYDKVLEQLSELESEVNSDQ